GSAPALADVVAGHVALTFADIVAALPLIKDDKVRILGITSRTRMASAPGIPTIAESVAGFEAVSWVMLVVPANTPTPIVDRLHAEIRHIVRLPDVEPQLIKLGMIPIDSAPPGELRAFIHEEIGRWGMIVDRLGLAGSE